LTQARDRGSLRTMKYLFWVPMLLALGGNAYACPDGGSAPCRAVPGSFFGFEPSSREITFNVLPAPELDPGTGLSAVLLLAGTLIVIRGKR
jgi:hypothetical protein